MGSKNKKSKNNQKGEAGKSSVSGNHGKTVITDSRFAHAQSDPKFSGPRKDKEKVAIDERFQHALTDKRFAVSTAPIDKRGKRKKGAAENDVKRHYRPVEEEDEEIEERKRKRTRKQEVAVVEGSGSDDDSEEKESESEEESKKPGVKSSELELKKDSDSSEEEEEEEDDDDDEVEEESDGEPSSDTTDSDEDEVYSEEEDTFVQEENVPEIDKETRRLAVVNLDWSNVKAVDLFVLLSSFLPKGGFIESVAVYPSEFGLQRMEEEAAKGPVSLFDDGKGPKDSDENEDDDDDGEIDNKKLRAYELSRMRYYYAVVTCDSIATSDYLYKTCDGVEFERSSNKLDLRFIPDSMDFKHPPRDVAKEAPANYEGLDFHSRALQHSNIQLTWDEDEPQRANMLKRKFNADQLADLEFKEFLASDESETDEDDDTLENGTEKKPKKQELYRALLQSGEGSDEDEEEGGQDMEVTFNTDLENLSKRVLEKKDKQSESVWEAHLRKMKEKKKARRNRSKNSSEDESSETDEEPREEIDDFFVEEPSSKKGTKGGDRKKNDGKSRKHEEADKETEASRAELELLLADDNGGDPNLKGYNMKPKKAKGKKGKEIPEEGKIPSADLEDARFSKIFTSHLYALDPTDPQFKRSATYARQLQRKGGREESGPEARKPVEQPAVDLEKSKDDQSKDREKHEISSLVKSIKMKSKQAHVAASKVKMSLKK